MFVLTMGKNALRRAGAAIACMACIAGVLAAADRLGGGTVTAWGVAHWLGAGNGRVFYGAGHGGGCDHGGSRPREDPPQMGR